MPSAKKLVHENTSELDDLCREQDISYGDKTKAEKIAALADEDLSDRLVDLTGSNKPEVKEAAEDAGLDTEGTKSELLEALLDAQLSDHDTEVPVSDTDGAQRLPDQELSVHYDSVEQRLAEIREGAHKAVDAAIDRGCAYEVVESLRPKDSTEPIKIQPSSHERHPDTIAVLTVSVPTAYYPLGGAEKNPIFRESK